MNRRRKPLGGSCGRRSRLCPASSTGGTNRFHSSLPLDSLSQSQRRVPFFECRSDAKRWAVLSARKRAALRELGFPEGCVVCDLFDPPHISNCSYMEELNYVVRKWGSHRIPREWSDETYHSNAGCFLRARRSPCKMHHNGDAGGEDAPIL